MRGTSFAELLSMQGKHDMEHFNGQSSGHDPVLYSLISHLYKRSDLAPVKTGQGNECILVNLSNCSKDFLLNTERFFITSSRFKILIRGIDYYIEVLDGDKFADAYNKSM